MVLRPGPPKQNSWQISVCERVLSGRECSDLQRQSYHYLHGQHTAQISVLYGSGSRLLSPQADTAGMQGILCRAPNRRVPDANVCSTCGTREHAQGHECTPKCTICGDDHIKWQTMQEETQARSAYEVTGGSARTEKTVNAESLVRFREYG